MMPSDSLLSAIAGQGDRQFGPDLKQIQQMQALQLRMQQLQQVQQGENALRSLYQNKDNVDPATNALRPNALRQLMQVSPSAGQDYMAQAAQIEEREARKKALSGVAWEKGRAVAHEIGTEVQTLYDQNLPSLGPKLAIQESQKRLKDLLDDAGRIGAMSPEQIAAFPQQYDPINFRKLGAAYNAALAKPLTQEQQIDIGFKTEDQQRARRKDRQSQAEFERTAREKPDDVEITKPDGSKVYTTAAWDRDQNQYVSTDGTKTPIEGNVRKVSPTNQASSDALDASAEQIASYNAPPLSGFAMARGQGPEIMKRIKEVNPEYNAQKYQVAQRVRNDFASGAQSAKSMDAMNTVVHHLSVFDDLGKALQNRDTNAINRVVNYVRSELGHPEVTNFDTAKGIISDEVIKAVVGSGAVFDREGMQRNLNSARSPEQLQQQASEIRRLMAGRMGAMYQRWSSVPLPADEFVAKLEPETIEGIRGYAPSNLKKALGEGEKAEGGPGAASTARASGPAIPPAAVEHLKKAGEGVPVDFGPGKGIWRLKGGQPVRDPGT
jgi:hypothetical protein